MTRICLTMIVKDEAHVIERCLASAVNWIDHWIIVDTGSTDGTARIIKEFMASHGVPGELHERPWVNFGHNRNEVLDLARMSSLAEYAVWIDADEEFTASPTSRGDLDLTLDGYFVTVRYDGLVYQRLAVTSLSKDWRWVGPVHEYLELAGAVSGNLDRPGVKVYHEGARSRDPETYAKDAAALKAALDEDPDNTRLAFYYAQSLRDSGLLESALEAYAHRANMGGWDQEVFIARLEQARLKERLGQPAIDTYLAAYNACPTRAEALVEAARIERERERFAVAMLYTQRAMDLDVPGPEGLFVDSATYAWRRFDEYALAAWYTGRYDVARAAARVALLANPAEPRLMENVRLMG
jgi:tetratricopeptide (TPR) repeat protein